MPPGGMGGMPPGGMDGMMWHIYLDIFLMLFVTQIFKF
jgi:hypothetical protein